MSNDNDYNLARDNGLYIAQTTQKATPFWIVYEGDYALTHWISPNNIVIITKVKAGVKMEESQ